MQLCPQHTLTPRRGTRAAGDRFNKSVSSFSTENASGIVLLLLLVVADWCGNCADADWHLGSD